MIIQCFILTCPSCRSILRHLQETTLNNIEPTWEIAHNKQFLLLPLCFSILFNPFRLICRDFPFFWKDIFKFVHCRFVVCEKGLTSLRLCAYNVKACEKYCKLWFTFPTGHIQRHWKRHWLSCFLINSTDVLVTVTLHN